MTGTRSQSLREGEARSGTPFRVVIPARYASTRFPGKMLAELDGWPMIRHVWDRARRSGALEVVIATDDRRIADAATVFGATPMLTSPDHRSGTERAAEVATRQGWAADDIVVNCQGDMPLIPPESLTQVAELLAQFPQAAMATLSLPIERIEDYRSPHVVKVVCDSSGRALYFSRSPIPAPGHGATHSGGFPASRRHIGIYAYRVAALTMLAASPPCELEEVEKLEQLRALWLGLEIRVAPAIAGHGPDVDTPEDLFRVREFQRGTGEQG